MSTQLLGQVRRQSAVRDKSLSYLLDAVFVAFLKRKNLIGALFGVVNLLPRLLFFLLEEGNAIRKQLCVPFNAV